MSSLTGNWWPSLSPKEILVYCTLYPFLAASSAALSIYTLAAGNLIAIGLHVIDWLKELSMAKKISERTNRGKERLDGFFQQILFSVRTMLILVLLFSLQFTFLAFCGTIHAIYAALFKKDGSVTGRGIRWIANGISHMLVGVEIFEGLNNNHNGGDGFNTADGHHKMRNTNVVSGANGEVEAADFMEPTATPPPQQNASATTNSNENKEEQQQKSRGGATSSKSATTNETADNNKAEEKTTSNGPTGPAPVKKAQNPAACARARGLNPTYGSGAKRKSSVKMTPAAGATSGSNIMRCEVVNEGPHFNRTARGCLLPMVE